MIGQVLRISTVFANMMLGAGFALAITIAAAGTIERTQAGCYGCLHTSNAMAIKNSTTTRADTSAVRMAFGTRVAGAL